MHERTNEWRMNEWANESINERMNGLNIYYNKKYIMHITIMYIVYFDKSNIYYKYILLLLK